MMRVHAELDPALHDHQVALLDRDPTRARRTFAEFAAKLREHIADEEIHILPAYAQLGGDASNSPASQFEVEHRKLLAFVVECEQRLAQLGLAPGDRPILELLDRQSWFKSLMQHHDIREGRVLYRLFSDRLPHADQELILARCVSAR